MRKSRPYYKSDITLTMSQSQDRPILRAPPSRTRKLTDQVVAKSNSSETLLRNVVPPIDGTTKQAAKIVNQDLEPRDEGLKVSRNVAKKWSASERQMPDDLMKYKSATELMDLLDPFVSLYSTENSTTGLRKLRAIGAVAALNHLKRLDSPGLGSTEQERLERQFRSFALVVEAGMDTLHGKHISLSLNAVGQRRGYSSLLSTAAKRLRVLCQRCLSCPAISAAAAAAVSTSDEPTSARVEACQRCPLDSRSVALSLNALSKAGVRDEELLRDLAQVVAGRRLQGQNVGLVLNALARLGFRDETLLRRLAAAAASVDDGTLDAQAVANTANALAKLGVLEPAAMCRLSAAARALPRTAFSSQAVANILNSFAKLGVADPLLFAHLSAAAMDQPSDSFSPHAISSIANAVARAGVADAPLLRYLSIAAQRKPARLFTLQGAYNLVNAYDRAGATDPRLVAHLAQTVLAADSATLHEAAHVAAAFARLEPPRLDVLKHRRPQGAELGGDAVAVFG